MNKVTPDTTERSKIFVLNAPAENQSLDSCEHGLLETNLGKEKFLPANDDIETTESYFNTTATTDWSVYYTKPAVQSKKYLFKRFVWPVPREASSHGLLCKER